MDNDDKVKDEIIDDGTQNSQDSKELARLNREDDFSKELTAKDFIPQKEIHK